MACTLRTVRIINRGDFKNLADYSFGQSLYSATLCLIGGCVMLVPAYGYLFTRKVEIAIPDRGVPSYRSPTQRIVDGVFVASLGIFLIGIGTGTLAAKRRSRTRN